MKNDAGDPDVDVSITTRELNIMMRANHIEPKYLPEEEFDSPLGSGDRRGGRLRRDRRRDGRGAALCVLPRHGQES